MSEFNSHRKSSREIKRIAHTLKKPLNEGADINAASVETDVDKLEQPKESEESAIMKAEKSPKKGSQSKKTVEDILLGAFSAQHEKDESVKPAKISKLDLKNLNSLNDPDALTADLIDSLAKAAGMTDPSLDCLADLALSVTEANQKEWRQALFACCVQVASETWILKHRGSVDLFRDIFDEQSTNQNWLNVLEISLDQAYQKRIASLKSPVTAKSAVGTESLEAEKSTRVQKKILLKQQKNILLIGILWLINKGKCDLSDIIHHLNLAMVIGHGSKATLRDVSLFLAGQWLSPDSHVIKLLAMQYEQRCQLEDNLKRIEKLLLQKDQQIAILQSDLDTKLSQLADAVAESYRMQEELAKNKKRAEDQQLDERAARTHLRDSEGKVKAKAFNLLSEEVLDPLRLSLSALQRENPKTKVALHQIELVVESIERDLKWFKE